MVDAISQKLVTEIGSLAEKAAGNAVERTAVSSADAASFQAQVNGAAGTEMRGAETGGVHAAAANAASPSPPSADTSSMGDRILSGLEGMSHDMQDVRQKFVQDVSGNGKVGEMYKLQLDVAQITTNQTLLGQAGSKTSQGIQTLLKGQ